MKIRLSGGVVASGLSAWIPGPSGPVRMVAEPAVPLGEPVALGPEGARAFEVRHAVDALTRLVSAGGVVAAGAGVDLGSGFRSARLAGARGDQRDAVLAALRVLGLEQAGRLGDRAGFLVALFGPAATKRVGAAVTRAIAEGCWAAVYLASAASDILGPEQLEQVLALRPPEGVDLVQGPASALAQHLKRVLEVLPGPRRLELLIDLWARVAEYHAGLARRDRLLATQSRRDRVEDLGKRRKDSDDRLVVSLLPAVFTRPEPSLADIARWTPPDHYWQGRFYGLVMDALAATAMLRTAVAVADHGLMEGLARSADLLRAAEALLPASAAAAAARKVPGLTGLPSRPGAYVRDIHRRLCGDSPKDHRFAGFVKPRLACARDFALVIMQNAAALLVDEYLNVPDQVLRHWAGVELRSWRLSVGYTPARPPAEWGGIPFWPGHFLRDRESLSQRLAAVPGSDASDVEVAGDLLWYAELVDALAALYGHDAARGPLGEGLWFDHDPAPPAEPLTPRQDSITLAVSSAAQLIELGGDPPRHARGWREFAAGLAASTSISEAITSEFGVPAALAALDGTTVTGTSLRFRVARSARTLAEWSDYMGNCIAGQHYVDRASAGRSALTGLYDENGVLVVNAELVPRRPAVRGWRVAEIQARFNQAPDAALERRFREWVEAVPRAAVGEADLARPDEPPPARAGRRRPVPHLVEDVGPALSEFARRAWEAKVDDRVLEAFAALAGTAPDAALTRVRRLQPGPLADACSRALNGGTASLSGLWAATGVRPLQAAVAALDPALRDRFDQLSLLFDEPPLAKSLRRLVKLPAIDAAYALDRAARDVRRAIGTLAIRDDPVIARALTVRPAEPLLCALTIMITCSPPETGLLTVAPPGTVTVPGYPSTTLDDESGPWQRALTDARELGADTSVFWDQVAEHGLRAPAAWLSAGDWTALWSRAHRQDRYALAHIQSLDATVASFLCRLADRASHLTALPADPYSLPMNSDKPGKVLVTGASGFAAGHCISDLLAHGYDVRGTVRNLRRADLAHLRPAIDAARGEFELAEATLDADEGWDKAVSGCDYVLHVASPIPFKAPRHEDVLIRPAVDGTTRVLTAAAKAGVKRVVCTSSLDVITRNSATAARQRTEADWSDLSQCNAYAKSKLLAEKRAWDLAADHGFELAVIHPGAIIGPPQQVKRESSTDMVRRMLAGEMPAIPPLHLAFTDVRDLATVHRLALEVPEAKGNRYICANGQLPMTGIAAILKEEYGRSGYKISTRRLPAWTLRVAAPFNGEAKLAVDMLDTQHDVSAEKAVRELGWTPRTLRESVIDTAESLISAGVVQPRS